MLRLMDLTVKLVMVNELLILMKIMITMMMMMMIMLTAHSVVSCREENMRGILGFTPVCPSLSLSLSTYRFLNFFDLSITLNLILPMTFTNKIV